MDLFSVAAASGSALLAGLIGFRFGRRSPSVMREALEHKDAVHRELLANVSHEFRTPIAAIKGFAESLRGGAIEDSKTALQFVRIIEKHADRLSFLVDGLLEVANVETGRRPAQPEALSLSPVVWGIAGRLSQQASRRRVRIRVNVPAELKVLADPEHLSYALVNLCDNAIKYNRTGGEVEILGHAEGRSADIRIKDTGIGIENEDLPYIFERFHQRKRARAKFGGAGIKLSVVKKMVESNGGEVAVEESGPQGTTFRLSLPLAH
jgi:two-component system, OmpR family, phosphate regulon sensor histidine kinase PhoR